MSEEVESRESSLKKKLQVFLGDLQKFGTTHGFKHFTCYLRGKEELVVCVRNHTPNTPSRGPSRKQSLRPTDSFSSACLPYDKTALTLSHNTQVGLSGLRDKGIGLPPASPSEEESSPTGDVTKFLIAGYARYSCPYVWVRSNHDRLMRLTDQSDREKDCPLRLKSTGRWHEGDVHAFEVVAELVKLSTYPPPRNPFEVDTGYLHNLCQPNQMLATAAMLNFLDRLVMVMGDSNPYTAKVFEELQQLAKLHFSSLQDVIDKGKAPFTQSLQQQQQQQQQQQEQERQQSHRHRIGKPSSAQRQSSYPSSTTGYQYPNPNLNPNLNPNPNPGPNPNPNPPRVVPTTPVNANSIFYGQGPSGVFPGGFQRMPAPSMF